MPTSFNGYPEFAKFDALHFYFRDSKFIFKNQINAGENSITERRIFQ